MEYIKKHAKEIGNGLVSATVVLFVIPRIIAWMHSFTIIKTDTSNDWLSFWGGYLGAIIGGIITLIVMWCTLKNENNSRKREEKINYFNQIISVWSLFFAVLGDMQLFVSKFIKTKKSEDYEKALMLNNKICEQSIQLTILLNVRKNQYDLVEVVEKLKVLSEEINRMMDLVEDRFLSNDQIKTVEEISDKIDILKEDFIECLGITITERIEN